MDARLDVLIHYWSATGNTALAARTAAAALEGAGARVSVRDLRADDARDAAEADLWVLATPIFDFRPALPVETLLAGRTDLGGVRTACILTCSGWADRSPSMLARWLRAAGAAPWDYATLVCEDSWPVARRYLPFLVRPGHPTAEGLASFRAWWAAVPGRIAAGDTGRRWWTLPTPFSLAALLYHPALLRRTFTIWVDEGRCTGCGACEARCPTGRMRRAAFPKPVGDCVGCYGCVNACPVDAIDTWLTRGASRYRGPRGEA